ncbi:MAG: PEP-CTERM sorting domain-containing protein [Planctomycetaceae bacterium]
MRVLLLSLVLLTGGTATADLVQEFKTDNSSGIVSGTETGTFSSLGNEYTRTLTGLMDGGVTFDATLTIFGSDDVAIGATGLGVGGSSSPGGGSLGPTENLRFAGFSFSNVSGGTVVFNEFRALDVTSFGAGDAGVLSDDDSTPDANDFFTVSNMDPDLEGLGKTDFYAISTSGAWRIDDVTASFTGTAVPEPSSCLLIGLACLAGSVCRRRRRADRSRLVLLDSDLWLPES